MGGGGGWGGNFQLARIFFFRSLLAQEFFFQVSPSARIFFFSQILVFFEQWNLHSLSMFLCFINYSTLATDQRIQATLMQNLFENVHTVRDEEATWSERFPCAFFQFLPSGIPLPQPTIMMPYSIHQWKPYFVVPVADLLFKPELSSKNLDSTPPPKQKN